ncbi:23S rRNA (uracil(1939)-C(5))-methyltransferase RlmD [Enterobacteriaceae bacterium LUAb1]
MAQFYSVKRRMISSKSRIVTIESLDPFGQGVTHDNGKTLFVPGALPGERVEITLEADKRQYARGKVLRVLQASPERVVPRCPHFLQCGGCQQQHVTPEQQQHSKASALSRLLSRETGLTVNIDEVISAGAWGYRRRARLALKWQIKTSRLEMGFRQEGSHALVHIQQCPVLRPELEALIQPLRQCLETLQAVRRLGHVELVLADNGPLLVLRHLSPLHIADRKKLEQFSHKHQLALFLAAESDMIEQISGEQPWYQVAGVRLHFSPRDFIQINADVNERMVNQALCWLDLQPTDRVLDLFCGMGNFTFPAGNIAQKVTGVEGVAELVEMARYNAVQNHFANVTFFHENLEDDAPSQAWAAEGIDKVLLDPARAGAAGAMRHIVQLAPERIVYVSCNPATLARDSKLLLQAGYQLERVAMLDMFPHTSHLESMVLFCRCKTV